MVAAWKVSFLQAKAKRNSLAKISLSATRRCWPRCWRFFTKSALSIETSRR